MWLYMTSFFLTLFGFTMITLRAAYRVSWADEDEIEAEHDLKLMSNTQAEYPPVQYGQPAPAVSSPSKPMPYVDPHLSHPITISPSMSPLPVPARAKNTNDDGFDC